MNSQIPADERSLRAAYHDYIGRYGKSRAITAMATDYGCSPRTVARHLSATRIRAIREIPDCPGAGVLRERCEAIEAEHGARAVTGRLASEYEVTQTTIRKWLGECGIRIQKPRVLPLPITEPCPCGDVATTRYRGQGPPLCFRCYMRTYAADKDSNFRRTAREFIAAVKAHAVCADCGGIYPPCVYHFDHVPERGQKLFNIGSGDYAIETVRAEIAKCDIVCANCHAIRTWIGRGKAAYQPLAGEPALAASLF